MRSLWPDSACLSALHNATLQICMLYVHNRFLPQVPINQPGIQYKGIQSSLLINTQLLCLLIVRTMERLDQCNFRSKLEVPRLTCLGRKSNTCFRGAVLPSPDKHSRPHSPKTRAIFEAFTATYQQISCCMIFQSTTIKNKKHNVWGGILSFFYFCSPFLDST